MFTTYIGKPVLARCLRFEPGLESNLEDLFPRQFQRHPVRGFGCFVGGAFVPLSEGDWIVASGTYPDRFQVFTEAHFNAQFQRPEEIEILP